MPVWRSRERGRARRDTSSRDATPIRWRSAGAIIISAYALPYGLFQLLYGPIGDRVGKLRVMAACLTVFSFGTFACAFVPNIPVFATLRFLTGVAAAAVVPMSLGYIGDKFPYQDRQIALARFMSALMIGQIVGSM